MKFEWIFIVCGIIFSASLPFCDGRLRSYEDLLPQCMQKSTKIFSSNNFRKAQEELKSSLDVKSRNQDQAAAPVPWAGAFYNTDWGCNLYNISGNPIAYSVVFKVNSENIHNSLATLDYQHQIDPIDLRTDWKKHVSRFRSTSIHDIQEKVSTRYNAKSVLQTFTFIRDPLDHFISGLLESYFRGLGYGPHPQLKGKETMDEFKKAVSRNQVDMNMTKTIIHGIIFGRDSDFLHSKLKQWKHFYPQFFSIRKWQPKFIGYLDNFDEDWIRMQSKLNVNVEYTGKMTHLTQADIFGFKKSLKELFGGNPAYTRAMCHLLIRDYICLGFELPVPCVDMYDMYEVDFNALLASNTYNE